MTDEKIFNFLRNVLTNKCFVKVAIHESSHLSKDLGLDSVGAMTLMTEIESEYKIEFDVTQQPPSTVKELVQRIQSMTAK